MNRQVLVLFLTLFIVMVGFGIIIPIMPFYVTSLGATSLHLGLLMSSFSLVQFIFAPIWGRLSDRVGRKPLIAIGLVGYVVSNLMLASASAIWMLFAARILGGMLSSATLPTAQAYIADTTSVKDRGRGMGMMGAAMGLGMVFGPALGGMLSSFGLAVPFLAGALLASLNLLFVLFFLPESRRGDARVPVAAQGSRLLSLGQALTGRLAFYFVLAFLVSFAMANLESTFSLYSQARLGFTATDMGIVFTFMGISGAVMQGAVMGKAIDRIGEERLIQAGLLATAVGFLLILTAVDLTSMIVFAVAQNVGGSLLRPSIASLLSKRTTEGQGTTMGLQASFDSLGRIAGPAWGGWIFESHHTYPYLTGAAIFLMAFLASVWRSLRTPVRVFDLTGND